MPDYRIPCPLDGCDWTHDEPISAVPDDTLAAVFGIGMMAAAAHTARLRRLEDALREHFAGHKPEDYLRTITRLNMVINGVHAVLGELPPMSLADPVHRPVAPQQSFLGGQHVLADHIRELLPPRIGATDG